MNSEWGLGIGDSFLSSMYAVDDDPSQQSCANTERKQMWKAELSINTALINLFRLSGCFHKM